MKKRRCIICGKEILVKESHLKRGWGKYCSKKCQSRSQRRGKWVKCSYCKKDIYRTPRDFKRSASKKFFCSASCHCSWENENSRSGENAPNWVSGEQVYRKLMKKYGIFEKCNKCGCQDERVLVVHHRDGNRKNNKTENLEWLCRNCHYIVHLT